MRRDQSCVVCRRAVVATEDTAWKLVDELKAGVPRPHNRCHLMADVGQAGIDTTHHRGRIMQEAVRRRAEQSEVMLYRKDLSRALQVVKLVASSRRY